MPVSTQQMRSIATATLLLIGLTGCARILRPFVAAPVDERVLTFAQRGQGVEEVAKDKSECRVEAEAWADGVDRTGRTTLLGGFAGGALGLAFAAPACILLPPGCGAFITLAGLSAVGNGIEQGMFSADLTALPDRAYSACMMHRG